MNRPLRILHLEDDRDYCDLVRAMLVKEGFEVEAVLADGRAAFEEALAPEKFDLILADYLLPAYNGLEALRTAREKCPETPFLLVSGTIGEQAAIESLRAGATDYVLKHWPERLIPAVRRAVEEAEERRQRRRIEAELVRREKYFRTLTENTLDILTILDREGVFVHNSPSVKRVLGYDPQELAGQGAFSFIHPEDLSRVLQAFDCGLKNPQRPVKVEYRFRHRDGSWRYLEGVGQNRLEDSAIAGVVVNSRDVTDRKRAEEALRESEQRYRLIFDSNPKPMLVFDHQTLAFLEVNQAAVEQYGYSREEFQGLTLKDIRPPEDVPAMIEYVHKIVAAGVPTRVGFAGVWRHRRKDGSLMDVEIKWAPISFGGRTVSLAMINDITEQKRIEHREAAFSKLGQSLSSATSPADAAGIIRAVTDDLFQWDVFTLDLYAAEQDAVYGILNADTDREGRRFDIPLTGPGREPSGMARRIIERGAELILREEPIVMPADVVPIGDTSRPSASLMLVPIRSRTKVIGILSLQSYTPKAYHQTDLDTLQTLADHCGGALERIRAEQALRDSEQRFRELFEGSPDAVFVEDPDGTVLDVNPAACRLHGLARADLIGQSVSNLVPPERREEVARDFKALVAGRLEQIEGASYTHDGRTVPVEVRASRINYAGQPAVLLHVRDITDRKRAEAALRSAEAQLRQSQKMEAIGQLAGGVAHDFNNILTVIHGHASLLLAGGSLPGTGARSAQQIGQAAERAASLTRQLLAFGRRQVMQPRQLDMNEVVSNMTKMLGRILGEDIALQLNYFPQPALVHADAGMMEQVLLNLAINSRDAMPKGGLLTIRILGLDVDPQRLLEHPEARAGRFVCLSVVDTGCGIPPENLRHIFEPFFTTKEVGKGTGLGLATVYGIVKQHQGWIEVESEPGQGTTFSVFLPRSTEPAKAPDEPPSEQAVRGGTETILVVEDEAPVRELVCDLLSRQGYQVLHAESGVKALQVWQDSKDRIDLLLTDLVMPDQMNGRELAEKLWVDRPRLKVIFTSGYSADVVGKDFVLCRGLNYLQKPYHPQKLALAVRDCLDAVN